MDENENPIERDPTNTDPVTERLRAFGETDVPTDARAEHLRRIASTPVEPARGFGRAWVAAAAIVGFLAGSTGLAAAGALPDPAQDVAHDVLSVVQIDVPEGKRGPCVSAIAKSDLPKEEKKAAKDACPKGGNGGDDGDDPGKSDSAPGQTKHADDPCKGKPPWAGKKGLTSEERDAMKAERAATCGRDLDDEDDEDEIEELDDAEEAEELESVPEQRDAVTTTTAAPETTTTTEATTTTVAESSTTAVPDTTATEPEGSTQPE